MRNIFRIILTISLMAVLVLPMTSPILSIAPPSTVWAQEAPEIEWIRQFGTASRDIAYGISVDSTGIYVAGDTYGALPGQTSAGGDDAFVRKYDASGSELWTSQFGTASRDEAWGISVDSTGIYVAGNTFGALPGETSAGDQDAFVRKYDASVSELWTDQFGTAKHDYAYAISVDSTDIYVAGATYGALPGQTSAGSSDAFVRKYDASGSALWTRQFGTASMDWAYGIFVDSTGIYVAGVTYGALPGQTSAGESDAFVRKYDASGSELWTRQFGTASRDVAWDISVDSTGIYVAGRAGGALPGETSAGGDDAFVRKYDASGSALWTRQFGTASMDVAFGISVDPTGVYVTGRTYGAFPGETSAGDSDAFVRKYDASGSALWTLQFGTASSEQTHEISVDSTGIYVAGFAGGALPGQTSAGDWDAFLVKLGEAPTPTPTPSNGEEGGCFIATAAYGSYLDSHVETLRDFRDSYMVTNPVGSALVSAYYKLSPPVAEFIDDHPALKPLVRAGLLPAVAMSTVAVNTTSAEKIAIVGSLALVSVALAVWLSRRRGKGSEYS